MSGDEALELAPRKAIYDFLKRSPGAHFSEVQRQLDMATGTLQYHLNFLEKRRLVDVRRDGRYTRYYPSLDVDRRHKPLLGILRQATPRQLLLDLLEHGPSRLTELSERLGIVPSTLSFHLKKLAEADVITRPGRGVYAVKEPDLVVDLLIAYRSSFLDAAVDRVVNLFAGTRPARAAEPEAPPEGEQPGTEPERQSEAEPQPAERGPDDEERPNVHSRAWWVGRLVQSKPS